MRNNRTHRTMGLVALAAGMLAVTGCGQSAAPQSGPPPAPVVSVTHPKSQVLVRVVEQPGMVQSYEETQLYARVPGYVGKLRREIDIGYKVRGPRYDDKGKEVEPGEELAELLVPELREEVNLKHALTRQAEADVEQARKAAVAAEANVATVEASVTEARALKTRWESESKRMAGLLKSGTVDLQNREEIQYQFEAAAARVLSTEAAVRKAKADHGKALADIQAAEARVDSAKADALRAETMLGYSKIRAPYDGVVTLRKASTGDLVQPVGGRGDWLFRVARLDPVRIVLAVPEADAELIQDKAEVKMTVQALPGPSRVGKVARTSWTLDEGARTLRTEVELDNKDGRLRPGMYVYARISNPLPKGWTLPTTALAKQGDATVCFALADGKAVRTPVQLGRSDGKYVVVLKRQRPGSSEWVDFTENDVIAERAAGLTDGQAVQIESTQK